MSDTANQTSGNLALGQKKVIVIEATEKPETKKLRVAAYARVSSDSTDQLNSFLAQVNYYNTLISSKEEWTMVEVYADGGKSGTSAEKRPDFQRMLSDCRKGRIDKILVKSISRFARNTKECLEIVRELKAIGIGVCFEEQNIDTSEVSGELLTAVFAAIAQKESESISQNMRWSYQHRMESGTFLPSSMAFGYRLEGRKIVIEQDEAEVVRRIFQEYLTGNGAEEIAKRLVADGIPGPERRQWCAHTVAYILSNERYIGDSLWQKTYCTDTLPTKLKKNRGEKKQFYAIGTHEAIIDKETFHAVQELRETQGVRFHKEYHEQPDPLQGKIRCAECGSIFKRRIVNGRGYWSCRKHFFEKESCPVTQIPEMEVHAAFLRIYHKLKRNGTSILTQLIADLRAVQNRRMLWSMDIISLNRRISELSDQNHTLANMNRLGLVDSDLFISKSNDLAQQLRAAKQERERLIDTDDDDTIEQTRDLLEILEASPDFLPEFQGDIFNELVDHITAGCGESLTFHLRNRLELTEKIERAVR